MPNILGKLPIRKVIARFMDLGVLIIVFFLAVLPSVGIGALSAREAEGRTNISGAEKV